MGAGGWGSHLGWVQHSRGEDEQVSSNNTVVHGGDPIQNHLEIEYITNQALK